MRRITALAATFAVFGVLASPVAAATKSINWVLPYSGTVSVKKGDSVTWSWSGMRHNVVGTGLNSPKVTSGSVTRKFTAKGSFVYYCAVHGKGAQKVTIKVS